jgi:hypothetical protein
MMRTERLLGFTQPWITPPVWASAAVAALRTKTKHHKRTKQTLIMIAASIA